MGTLEPHPIRVPMPDSIRTQAIFHGTVQGVGFRAITRHQAGSFQVTGTVRNLPDGTVELIAEGNSDQVQRFIGSVEEVLRHRIEFVDRCDSEATDEFTMFQII